MLLSAGFAVLLLVAVAVFYLVPRRERCPECGLARQAEAPLCPGCGWVYGGGDRESDDDYGDRPEVIDEEWAR